MTMTDFYDWSDDPPAPDDAIKAVYRAFAGHSAVTSGFCRQCFDIENERRIQRPVPLRNKAWDDFSFIFHEHPECSVGADGYLHFLPRALETAFFDDVIYPELIGQAVKCGLYMLPEPEQAALRRACTRAAKGWFEAGDPAPFGGLDPPCDSCGRSVMQSAWRSAAAGCKLVVALVHARVEPDQLFAWLAGIGTPQAWVCLADLINDDVILDSPAYFVVSRGEEALEETVEALDRLARAALFAEVSEDRLLEAALPLTETHPEHAKRITNAADIWSARRPTYSAADRLRDRDFVLDVLTGDQVAL